MVQNRQWVLASHPDGHVKEEDFSVQTVELPALEDGQFRVKVEYFAFEPAMRSWITGRETYIAGVQVGDVMRSMAVGVIEESRNAEVPVGANVVGMFGWQEYVVGSSLREFAGRVIPDGAPPTWTLGVLGITGLTAYFGMFDIGEVKAGEQVLVSGAAGATGSVASQLAKHVVGAANVVGVAGGEQKCSWLTEIAKLDASIDYKALDERGLYKRVAELFPNGIDVFFDNVGGPILEAAIANLNEGGRIVLCGAISQYNENIPSTGPRNYSNLIIKRGKMQGFIVMDYAKDFAKASIELGGWVKGGKIAHEQDIQGGFENTPKTFLRLFSGANRGKQLLKL